MLKDEENGNVQSVFSVSQFRNRFIYAASSADVPRFRETRSNTFAPSKASTTRCPTSVTPQFFGRIDSYQR